MFPVYFPCSSVYILYALGNTLALTCVSGYWSFSVTDLELSYQWTCEDLWIIQTQVCSSLNAQQHTGELQLKIDKGQPGNNLCILALYMKDDTQSLYIQIVESWHKVFGVSDTFVPSSSFVTEAVYSAQCRNKTGHSCQLRVILSIFGSCAIF